MTAIVLRGDARSLPLPDGCVDLIVTSPPYWNIRDYRDGGKSLAGQIGSEETWQEYIANLLDCTREWVRVLKPSGSLFVNIADKYSERSGPGHRHGRGDDVVAFRAERPRRKGPAETGIPAKSLIGLPSRYVLACIDELGLIYRRDNIWHKVSGLPESATDRCTTRHEYVFHLTRQPSYYTAIDEIREPQQTLGERHNGRSGYAGVPAGIVRGFTKRALSPLGKLPGSVWEIAAAPLIVPEHIEHGRCCGGRKRPGCEDGLDHHAAFPPELARKCILGWSPPGICVECGQGRFPVTTKTATGRSRNGPGDGGRGLRGLPGYGDIDRAPWREGVTATILGYACACTTVTAPTRPALIVDPFGGTGTTALVADVLGRNAITVDRSADYCRLAQWRTTDPGERARARGVPKPPPVPDGQGELDLFGGDAA